MSQNKTAKPAAAAPGRIPPQNVEAEMSVLGSMMLGNKEAVETALSILTRECFYRDTHAHIFDAMQDMANLDKAIDVVTLRDELTNLGVIDQIGGLAYLVQLADIEFTTANIAHYARIVKDAATRRQAIEAAGLIALSAYEPDGEPIAEFLDNAERLVFGLRENRGSNGTRDTLQKGMIEQTQVVNDRYHNFKKGIVSGILTGFDELDYMFRGGLKPGLLYIVGGRPGMGKTVTGCEIARNILHRCTGEVGHVQSLEMTKGELIERMVCAEAQISVGNVGMGDMTDLEWRKWNDAYNRLFDGRCVIDDQSEMTPLQLKAALRKTRSEMGGLDFVVVDYLQLLNGQIKGGGSFNTNDQIKYVSQSLKSIAKEFEVPVIALSQMNRASERREDKRPQLSDLRDSGGVESAADVVLLLYRAAYYDKEQIITGGQGLPERDELEINIAKHRNGATGTVKVLFTPEYTRLDNIDYRHNGGF